MLYEFVIYFPYNENEHYCVHTTNKTNRYDIDEILLKVALNTIKQTKKQTDHIRGQ
jgi:hypothetical protein